MRFYYFEHQEGTTFAGIKQHHHHTVSVHEVKDPRDAQQTFFSSAGDRRRVHAIVARCAAIMQIYEEDRSAVWDHTCDITSRPQWLRDIANEEH